MAIASEDRLPLLTLHQAAADETGVLSDLPARILERMLKCAPAAAHEIVHRLTMRGYLEIDRGEDGEGGELVLRELTNDERAVLVSEYAMREIVRQFGPIAHA